MMTEPGWAKPFPGQSLGVPSVGPSPSGLCAQTADGSVLRRGTCSTTGHLGAWSWPSAHRAQHFCAGAAEAFTQEVPSVMAAPGMLRWSCPWGTSSFQCPCSDLGLKNWNLPQRENNTAGVSSGL